MVDPDSRCGGGRTGQIRRLEYKEGGTRRNVSVREENGKTRIAVASIGGRASN